MTIVKEWEKTGKSTITGVTTDSKNNVYSVNFATKLAKFNHDGTQVWQKTLAGTSQAVAVDSMGNLYIGDGEGTLLKLKEVAVDKDSLTTMSNFLGFITDYLSNFKANNSKDKAPTLPIHPNCRCSLSAWFDADKYEQMLRQAELNK